MKCGDAGLDLGRREAKALGRPVIELRRQFSHGRIAACLDVGKNAFDGGFDTVRVGRLLLGFRPGFNRRIIGSLRGPATIDEEARSGDQ